MEAVSRSLDELLAALGPGVTLVTATQRLTRHLRSAYDERQRRGGCTVWESPDILPWPAWLRRCGEAWLRETIRHVGTVVHWLSRWDGAHVGSLERIRLISKPRHSLTERWKCRC